MRKNIFAFLFLWLCLAAGSAPHAQRLDTVNVHSAAMDRDIKALIITPAGYDDMYAMPVVYLLHGYGDNCMRWCHFTQPKLPQLASQYGIMLVCPSGDNSWYFDSPVNPASQFETFVSKELIDYVDSHYKTIRSHGARAITGYSMGGHGSLWLAFRHPDVFGQCGTLSGGVDFRAFPDSWDIKQQLGEMKDNKDRWDHSTVVSLVDQIKPGQQRIAIDCGTEDFFLPCNKDLHQVLLEKHIPHDFTIRPGGHDHGYWRNAILYQLLFFTEGFKQKASQPQ